MTFASGLSDVAAGSLLVRMANGVGAFVGITAAADGTTGSIMDITVATGAWALLPNGKFFDASNGLVTAAIPGNTVTGTTYHLYLDGVFDAQSDKLVPTFSVGTAAPSASALTIAGFHVSGSVISQTTVVAAGLGAGVPVSAFNGATTGTAPSAGGGSALPATPAGYVTVTVNGTAQQIAYY